MTGHPDSARVPGDSKIKYNSGPALAPVEWKKRLMFSAMLEILFYPEHCLRTSYITTKLVTAVKIKKLNKIWTRGLVFHVSHAWHDDSYILSDSESSQDGLGQSQNTIERK